MQYQIKNIIDTTYEEKTFKEVGYDEELPLISFSAEGLKSVITAILHVAADLCVYPEDAHRILHYARGNE